MLIKRIFNAIAIARPYTPVPIIAIFILFFTFHFFMYFI